MKYFKWIFVTILFCLLCFGIYKSFQSEQYGAALATLAVLFFFSYLMAKTGKITNWSVGGDKLNISVNQDQEDNKDAEPEA